MNKYQVQTELETKFNELQKNIDTLSEKAEDASEDIKNSIVEQIKTIEGKRDEIKRKMDDLQNKSESAWENMKDGINESFDVLQKSIDKVTAEFK